MWANTKHSQLWAIADFLLAISFLKQNTDISGHRLSVTLLDSEFRGRRGCVLAVIVQTSSTVPETLQVTRVVFA